MRTYGFIFAISIVFISLSCQSKIETKHYKEMDHEIIRALESEDMVENLAALKELIKICETSIGVEEKNIINLSVPYIFGHIFSDNAEVKKVAQKLAEVYSKISLQANVEIENLLYEVETDKRIYLLEILATSGNTHVGVDNYKVLLYYAAYDPEIVVRTSAIKLIGQHRLKPLECVASLISVYNQSGHNIEIKTYVIGALGEYAKAGDSTSLEFIDSSRESRVEEVRLVAEYLYKEISEK